LRLNPAYADAHVNLAYVLVANGHELEAVDHYRKALDITPQSIEARRNLALALDRVGKRDEAVE
jgi:Flp pilus assembly protein TadD